MLADEQTELAAELIDQLRVPDGARVVVLGDAAFDAAPILAACHKRHFGWIVTTPPGCDLSAGVWAEICGAWAPTPGPG